MANRPTPYILALLFWITTIGASASVLDAPELRCATVLPNGDVELSWLQPPDPTNVFASYEIWMSNSQAGPYANVGSVGIYGQLNFIHVGAGANSAQVFYYLETHSTAPPPNISLPSDTLGTIYLEVGQSTPLGSADLSWTHPHAPALPSSAANYELFLEYPLGTWTLLDQVPVNTDNYLFEISICDDSLNFRIELQDASGCTSVSNIAGDRFEDQTPPDAPEILAVTVDTASGLANINWTPSPQADTDGYIIVQVINGSAIVLDTVYGGTADFYEYLASNANNESEYFTIAAFDTCWSGQPPSPNTSATLQPHQTIHLQTSLDRCASEMLLNWNEYYWPNGVQQYRVYVSLNGGPYGLLATLPPGTTAYLHTGVNTYANYCYVIEAVENGPNISLSNKACRTVDYPQLPTYNYLATATVQPNGIPSISDLIDPAAEVQRYELQRSEAGGAFQTVNVLFPQPGPYITFEDPTANTDQNSYEYRVQVVDSCGQESIISNVGTTMLLKVQAYLSGINELDWNGYQLWDGAVDRYEIYRRSGNDPFFTFAGSVPPNQWTFDDDVSGLIGTNGRFCYYVVAVESGNPSGVNETSSSNVACAVQDPGFYLPNALTIGGYNPTFGPVFSFTEISNYQMEIFNRWGQPFFSTNDPYAYWDGTHQGDFVQQGVYVYFVSYQNGSGRTFNRQGTVTVLYSLEE